MQKTLVKEEIKSACQFCPCECGIIVTKENGQVRNIYGEERDPVQNGTLCPKSQLMPQLTYNPYRITKPLRRKFRKETNFYSVPKGGGCLQKDSDGNIDVEAMGFEAISYDTAIKEIAQKLVNLKIKHGSEVFGAKMSSRSFRSTGAIAKNFFRLFGSHNITSSGPVCNDSAGDALKITYGTAQHTNSYGKYYIKGEDGGYVEKGEDLGSSNLYLIFGGNMAEQRPVLFTYLTKKIAERKKLNTGKTPKMVVVDPRYTQTAARADQWIQIRPGTDMALAYGMIHHIINNNLIDEDFCNNWIAGYEELKRHVNEQGYDTRWASEITNISEKIIITLAEEYAKAKPAAIFTNAGIAHHINAFDTFRVLLFLISITGNIGKPGAGANFTNNAGISKSLDKKLKNDSLYKEKSKKIVKGLPSHPDYFAKSILLNSPVPEDKSIKPYSLRSVYYAGNMLTQNANTEEVKNALASPTLELFIKPALFWEEDCYYADYILPVKTHLESDGIGVRRDDRAARWKNVVIDATDIYTDPEIISEDELWIRLGEAVKLKEIEKKDELIKHNRFCLDTSFWERYLPSDWKNQQGVWKEIGKQNPSSARFSYENMKGRTEPLHWPCPDIKDSNGKPHPGTGILYTDEKDDRGFWLETSIGSGKFEKGEKHKRFWTSDGKVLIYTKNLDRTLRGLQPDEPEETLKDLSNTKTGHTALPKFYTDPIYPNLPTMSYTNNKWIKNPIKTNNMTMQAEIVNAPSDEKNSKYPYLLITGRPTAVHFHSYSHWMWHSVQMNAHRTIQINPKTADILKVKKNGENVKIETTWGVISAPVLIWDGLADNTVFIPIGFGDKQQVHKDTRKPIYSSVNILTNNEIFDTLSYQMPYKLHRCMIKNLGDCKRFDTNL